LLVITTVAVYKPWGTTPYGRRRQQQERRETQGTRDSGNDSTGSLPFGLKILLAVVALMISVFVVVHLAGGGLGRHTH